jgi:ubiquinone/menaquinone biosynthesis C-methylase UbiE
MTIEAAIVSQFAKPTGILGRLVRSSSRIAARTSGVDLLELSPRDQVLEMACGPGVALAACLKRLEEGTAVGVDHSDVMISHDHRRNACAVEMKRLRLIGLRGGLACLRKFHA